MSNFIFDCFSLLIGFAVTEKLLSAEVMLRNSASEFGSEVTKSNLSQFC